MAADSPASSLPWLWVIESIASFKQVNMSVINDLVARSSAFSSDLGKNARERVALRCLEGLFDEDNGINKRDLPSSSVSKVQFDLSESCENVLQRIMTEVATSDLNLAGPELLKWDVHPFIIHKRACLPKCALEMLKDFLIEDTHPSAAFLREISGLGFIDQDDHRTPVDDGSPDAFLSRVHGSDVDNQIEPVCEPSTALNSENGTQIHGSDRDNQIEPLCGPSTGLNSENGNGSLKGDSPDKITLPSKRQRSASADGTLLGEFHEDNIRNGGDDHLNAKKYKLGSTEQPVGQDLVPVNGNKVLHSEREGYNLAEEIQGGSLEAIKGSEDGHDGNLFSKRSDQSGDNNDIEVQHNQLQHCNNELPQDASGNANEAPNNLNGTTTHGTRQKNSTEGVQEDIEDDASSDSDGYNNEKIEVASKKHSFLSSQCTFADDSPALDDWTERNLCMKCNKDGQVLKCSGSGCLLVVHENCLGSSVCFDNLGNFYCPFCAYSCSISKYIEAKKEASRARKKLNAFISFGQEHMNLSKSFLHKKKKNQSRQSRKEEYSQENHQGEHGNPIDNHQIRGRMDDKQQAESSVPHVDSSPSHREEEITAISGTVYVNIDENQGGEKMVKESEYVRRIEGQESELPTGHDYDGDNISSRNTETILVSWKHAEDGTQEEVLRQEVNERPPEPAAKPNCDMENTSDEENDKFFVSNYFIRYRREEKRYTYPAIPMLRRKKIAWTTEEEEILKEGVQRFSNTEDRSIPWKEILEFGREVFLKSRTTIDLKDKWRNICKASSPKSK